MRWIPVFALCLCIGLVSQVSANHLHRSNGGTINSLHPHHFHGEPEASVMYDLFEGLVTQSPEGKIVAGLAETFKQDTSNPQQWIFELRAGLKWSDGSPLTATDFVESFRRLALLGKNKKSIYAKYLIVAGIKNAAEILAGSCSHQELGVSAPDDRTVIIELDENIPPIEEIFPALLAFPSFLPVHSSMRGVGLYPIEWEKPGNSLICCGPYKLVSVELCDSEFSAPCLTLSKNTSYHSAESVTIPQVSWHGITNLETEEAEFRAKRLQITKGLPTSDFAHLDKTHMKVIHMLATGFLMPRTQKIPMPEHQDLIQAIAAALELQDIIKELGMQDYLSPATSFIPDFDDFHPFQQPPARDKAAENTAIKKACDHWLTSHPGKTVLICMTPEREDPGGVMSKIIDHLNQRFQDAGGQLSFISDTLPWNEFRQGVENADLLGWGWLAAYNEPSAFIVPLAPMFGMIPCHPVEELNTLYYQARCKKADWSGRKTCYLEAAKVICREVPVIPLFKGPKFRLVSPTVKNYPESNLQGWAFTKWLSM
ncbi:ABC transporter substrate-binding protein [Spongorhabdus nitratireducens]